MIVICLYGDNHQNGCGYNYSWSDGNGYGDGINSNFGDGIGYSAGNGPAYNFSVLGCIRCHSLILRLP